MKKKMTVDIAIIGGGIAGLWLLAELKAQGYEVLLCEKQALGAKQTIASQGIIHGGTKYALTGKVSQAALAIGDMPNRWREALQGKGAVDLREVNILSEQQYLWTAKNLASKITGFFASKAMKSRMIAVQRAKYPPPFNHPAFKGNLYQLDEPVLDISSLLQTLATQFESSIIKIDAKQSHLVQQSTGEYTFNTEQHQITAQQIIVTAGEGNEALSKALNIPQPCMQRRPLQMIWVKGKNLLLMYAHALGINDKPKITITSHQTKNNDIVWYIGGQPAEKGVGIKPQTLIKTTQTTLKKLLPWMDFHTTNLKWGTHLINRAEGIQQQHQRPNNPVLIQKKNVILAWPTKLALTPMLAQQILQSLKQQHITPNNKYSANFNTQQHFPIATHIWDTN